MRAYEVILHESAWAVLAATELAERRRLLALFESLKASPFRTGDFQQRDSTGRTNEILLLGEWLVTFWSDHAVCEIHTVELERIED